MSVATYEIPCAPCPDWRDVGGAHQFVLTYGERPIQIHSSGPGPRGSIWAAYPTFNSAVSASIRIGMALDVRIEIRDKKL